MTCNITFNMASRSPVERLEFTGMNIASWSRDYAAFSSGETRCMDPANDSGEALRIAREIDRQITGDSASSHQPLSNLAGVLARTVHARDVDGVNFRDYASRRRLDLVRLRSGDHDRVVDRKVSQQARAFDEDALAPDPRQGGTDPILDLTRSAYDPMRVASPRVPVPARILTLRIGALPAA